MLDYIKQMLAGEDGKPSSNKLLKFAAFFAAVILCIIDLCIADLEAGAYVGAFLGYAFGQDLSQKISNAVYSNGKKVELLPIDSVQGK